jgi:hypothetical protein
MCDNFVTFLPCGIGVSSTARRLNDVSCKTRRERIKLMGMEKDGKLRQNYCTADGM